MIINGVCKREAEEMSSNMVFGVAAAGIPQP